MLLSCPLWYHNVLFQLLVLHYAPSFPPVNHEPSTEVRTLAVLGHRLPLLPCRWRTCKLEARQVLQVLGVVKCATKCNNCPRCQSHFHFQHEIERDAVTGGKEGAERAGGGGGGGDTVLERARCECAPAVAGAARRAPSPDAPASDLPRGPRAVASRRRPRVPPVTLPGPQKTSAHRVRAGSDGRGALREAGTMV